MMFIIGEIDRPLKFFLLPFTTPRSFESKNIMISVAEEHANSETLCSLQAAQLQLSLYGRSTKIRPHVFTLIPLKSNIAASSLTVFIDNKTGRNSLSLLTNARAWNNQKSTVSSSTSTIQVPLQGLGLSLSTV